MRPHEIKGDFLWEGFDGNRILAHGIYGGYGTLKGQALEKIQAYAEEGTGDIGLCLWGVGNHGGGPSRIDLEAINTYIKTSPLEILHSGAEDYMKEVDQRALKVIDHSLIPCMVGCYTSMVRIKQANRRLENKLAMTEKIMSYAEMTSGFVFDKKELKKAKKALAFCQFHDILPGSAIKAVEEDALRTFGYGEEIADRLYTKAFFKLCEGQKKAKDGEIPILVFNPHPYEVEGELEVGFMLENQNWNEDEVTLATVYDENGNALVTQNEKPDCTFNLDWIQKISFLGKLAPSSVTRFDCKLTTVKKAPATREVAAEEFVEVKNDRMRTRISKKTGLIDLFEVDGKVLLEKTGNIEVYKDNEDPWGMTVDSFKEYEDCFTLMSDEAANEFTGYPEESISNVRVVEDGAVRTKIQAFFTYKRSVAVVEYTIPKNHVYIDVNITVYSNEPNKMLKYRLDTKLKGIPYGETAFGAEALFEDERESVYHKWCGIWEENTGLYVLNKGTYGGSFTNSTIKISLLRTPVYAAHPIGDRQIAPHNRHLNHMDMGERQFSFRIATEKHVEREAQIFNEAPFLLSFFPSGEGKKQESVIRIDNPNILLTSVRKQENGYALNLHNFSDTEEEAELFIIPENKRLYLKFMKYELKTVVI